jgi:transposase
MLTGTQWAMLEPLVEQCRPKGKTTPQDLRRTFEALLWRHENSAKWRAVPAKLGPWWRAAQTFIRWARLGVWERLLNPVQECGIQLDMAFLDGTNVRASEGRRGSPKRGSQAQRDHREALGRSRGGYGTKACVIADGSNAPSRFALHQVRRTNCLTPFRCLTVCRVCLAGWWQIAAIPVTASASTSGASVRSRRSRPRPMRRRSPVRTGSTTTAMSSSGSGPSSKGGEPLQPATRKPHDPSWACSASPQQSTGSSANRP